MPVEMRLEDLLVPAPDHAPQFALEAAGTAPAALRDLIAARLVSHEAIGDPARLDQEAGVLRALCRIVAGPVYRLEPFHYAFMLRDGDLDDRIGPLTAEARIEALGEALAADLGPEALWVGETGLLADMMDDASAGGRGALPDGTLLVLRARDAAVTAGLAAVDPDLRAVIDARFAAEAARCAAEFGAAFGLEAATEAAIAALDRRIAALETLLVERLGKHDAARDAALEATAAASRAFEGRLGLALAEFLARLERCGETAAPAP